VEVLVPGALAPLAPAAVPFASLKPALEERFRSYRGHVCVMATGIVVRLVAGLLVHKAEDPAVVVVDEGGGFAISLVSGHLGGANALARQVAAVLGARPVITTATDVNGVPAVDVVALDEALTVFAAIDPRGAQVVELRFFGGLSVEETAHVLHVSPETVMRDWKVAKTWLFRELRSRGDEQAVRGHADDR